MQRILILPDNAQPVASSGGPKFLPTFLTLVVIGSLGYVLYDRAKTGSWLWKRYSYQQNMNSIEGKREKGFLTWIWDGSFAQDW